ncbi:hypothetical protein [Oceanibaculum pacificum]|uniref:Lipoprotein n=1 Tax=Oceanibaculum pacificum TaxID=580166 RepID=A0A154VP77_9PROT|nr:hypothetical protein [Oceanibaculum pacificum]KZD03065.1 hypothetical protein AUP43_03330 [Oceanibaculum pacificum]
MMFSAVCWRLRLAVLVIATTSLTACATVGSKAPAGGVCPPVVEYGREFQTQAADEIALLPEPSALAEMMSDYGVMREQARACKGS